MECLLTVEKVVEFTIVGVCKTEAHKRSSTPTFNTLSSWIYAANRLCTYFNGTW